MTVYCNDVECLWCKELEKRHIIKYSRDFSPAFANSGFIGECTRDDVGVEPVEIIGGTGVRHKSMKCVTRSDKKISGHLDFTKNLPVKVDEVGIKEYNKHKNNLHTQVGIDLKKMNKDNGTDN